MKTVQWVKIDDARLRQDEGEDWFFKFDDLGWPARGAAELAEELDCLVARARTEAGRAAVRQLLAAERHLT